MTLSFCVQFAVLVAIALSYAEARARLVSGQVPTAHLHVSDCKGAFQYEYDPEKLQLPATVNMLNGHGLARDADGYIYFTYESASVDGARDIVRSLTPQRLHELWHASRLTEFHPCCWERIILSPTCVIHFTTCSITHTLHASRLISGHSARASYQQGERA